MKSTFYFKFINFKVYVDFVFVHSELLYNVLICTTACGTACKFSFSIQI